MKRYFAAWAWTVFVAFSASTAGCSGGTQEAAKAPTAQAAISLSGAQPQAASAAAVSPQDAAEQLMDFAESRFPQFFPRHSLTQSSAPFAYRYYSETGLYLGVVVTDGTAYRVGDVYVMGGTFGGAPVYEGPLAVYITPVAAPSCVSNSSAAVTFSPCSLDVSYNEGDTPSILVDVTPHTAFAGTVYAVVVDPQQMLSPGVQVVANGRGGVTATLRPKGDRDFGVYSGNFDVHLCTSASCSAEYPGSPVTLPYRFTVRRSDPSAVVFNSQGSLFVKSFGPADARTLPLQLLTYRFPAAGLYVRATDTQGRVVGTTAVSGSPPSADFTVPVSLPDAAGGYSGSFTTTVCRDAACSMPLLNSSSTFNYQLYVAAALTDSSLNATPTLTTLAALPGAGDWSTQGGGAARAAYVPGTFDSSRFTLRWKWPLPSGKQYKLTQPTAAAGRVAISAQGTGGSADTSLFVLDEATGALRWKVDGAFSSQLYFSPPALTSSTLYTVTNGTYAATLRAYDAVTGSPQFATPVNSNFLNDLQPLLSGNSVVMAAGANSGVASLSLAGQQQWLTYLPGSAYWLPSSQGNTVFQYSNGLLALLNATTGATTSTITDAGWNSAYDSGPVSRVTTVGDAGMVFVVDRGLAAFNTASGSVGWSDHTTTIQAVQTVAAQGGTLIVLRQGPLRVEARRQSDGAVLWSYKPIFGSFPGSAGSGNSQFLSDPVLTDNLVFVSTDLGVYAIDRQSGTARWFFGIPGSLAITPNGTLLISNPAAGGFGGGVAAVNLR
jgi:hypothetical protein